MFEGESGDFNALVPLCVFVVDGSRLSVGCRLVSKANKGNCAQ